MPVFDFNNSPEPSREPECTYEIFYSSEPEASPEHPMLVLDNSAHIFPAVDSPEVMVTRRYYRSGESEYYINKQSVRLKDLNELFMDTGLGREGYSIIGQGRIDEILSVKSGDRREIFEEAAGISKFRHRKEETERKLERTEENLVRINDKIAELELQVEPLREQAEKAKRYLILRDELRVLEISVWLSNLEELKAKGRKLEADYAAAVEQQQQAQQALEDLYAANEQFGERTRQNDMDQEAVRREISDLEGRISEQDSAAAVLRTRLEHNSESMERIGGELSDQDSRSENLRAQIEQQRGRIQEIAEHMEQLEAKLSDLLQQAQEAAEGNRSAAQEAERLRGQEALSVAAAADARAELSALTAGIAQMENRQGEVATELVSAREMLEGKQAEAKQCRRRLRRPRDRIMVHDPRKDPIPMLKMNNRTVPQQKIKPEKRRIRRHRKGLLIAVAVPVDRGILIDQKRFPDQPAGIHRPQHPGGTAQIAGLRLHRAAVGGVGVIRVAHDRVQIVPQNVVLDGGVRFQKGGDGFAAELFPDRLFVPGDHFPPFPVHELFDFAAFGVSGTHLFAGEDRRIRIPAEFSPFRERLLPGKIRRGQRKFLFVAEIQNPENRIVPQRLPRIRIDMLQQRPETGFILFAHLLAEQHPELRKTAFPLPAPFRKTGKTGRGDGVDLKIDAVASALGNAPVPEVDLLRIECRLPVPDRDNVGTVRAQHVVAAAFDFPDQTADALLVFPERRTDPLRLPVIL